MNLRFKLRFAASVLAFGANLLFFGLCYWACTAAWKLFGTDRRIYRRRVAWLQSLAGHGAFLAICRCLNIRHEFDLPPGFSPDGRTSYVIVSNHRSVLDIFVIMSLVRRLRLPDARWVLKRQLRWMPFMGSSCKRTGCAFVNRDGSPGDLAAVERCGREAARETASVIIFPEGTRYTSDKATAYRKLLPPKSGGFETLCSTMPEAKVLSVTIVWGSDNDCKTPFQAANLCGTSMRVSVRVAELPAASPAVWLREEWRQKDRRLSGTPS